MATDASKAKPQFFLYAPFKRDSTFDERRKIAFPEHAARVTQMKKDGVVSESIPPGARNSRIQWTQLVQRSACR